jgi:hypothetical protein
MKGFVINTGVFFTWPLLCSSMYSWPCGASGVGLLDAGHEAINDTTSIDFLLSMLKRNNTKLFAGTIFCVNCNK